MPDSRIVALVLGVLAGIGPAWADEGEAAFKISGFLSAVAGRATGSFGAGYDGPSAIDGNVCPCYIADWGNAGVYSRDVSLRPESRAGVQLKYTVSPAVNLVGQLVVRGSDSAPNLQWAYASFTPSKNWEFQLGRKRIPLYFYSDFQDIGVSYPWVTVPPELYGWEATNYNGASARYKTSAGDSNLNMSLFIGKEAVKDSLYQRLYYDSKTRVTWGNLVGADLELSHGVLTTRAVYMQANVRTENAVELLDDRAKLRAYGIAANVDLDDWFILTEFTQLTRDFDAGYKVTAPAFTVGAGVHWGLWTPFLNYANYKEKSSDLSIYAPQSYRRTSLTLRYDIDTKSAFKAQADRNKDVSNNFGGNVTVWRIAYDRLF